MNDRLICLLRHMQLYVSVDAATKESLKAIDRPLFGDFWERFLVSISFAPLFYLYTLRKRSRDTKDDLECSLYEIWFCWSVLLSLNNF